MQSQVEQWLSRQISREAQAPVMDLAALTVVQREPEDDYRPGSFLLDEFDENAWEDWRSRTGISFLNSKDMGIHYQAIYADTPISDIPEKYFNRNTRLFIQGFEKNGYGFSVSGFLVGGLHLLHSHMP